MNRSKTKMNGAKEQKGRTSYQALGILDTKEAEAEERMEASNNMEEESKLVSKPVETGEKRIKLKDIKSHKSVILVLLLIGIIVALLLGVSLYLNHGETGALMQELERLYEVGRVQKTLRYMHYYLHRTGAHSHHSNESSPDPESEAAELQGVALLDTEIQLFYNSTHHSYSFIGDPHPILKKVYATVEELQKFIHNDDAVVPTQMHLELEGAFDQIRQLEEQTFAGEF